MVLFWRVTGQIIIIIIIISSSSSSSSSSSISVSCKNDSNPFAVKTPRGHFRNFTKRQRWKL